MIEQETVMLICSLRLERVGEQSNGNWWSEVDVSDRISLFEDTQCSDATQWYAWRGGPEDHDEAEKTECFSDPSDAIGVLLDGAAC